MTDQELEQLVAEKFKEADENFSERPKKFFVTENGRGVVDGGELYNQAYTDVLRVAQEAVTAILKEALKK
ncbi:hypothetical protein TAMA11512_10960 [Selenomonas sp. TAMA-11512]|uniref:hypothetical protein n=1 Tax=Selenomonas sp. TAMA-11512 TaxID=3095337 RepID=UPI00308EAD1A|nr:hypothetical protein TAMA11512_10960 [Selenomonas sp. TAMA-11512]